MRQLLTVIALLTFTGSAAALPLNGGSRDTLVGLVLDVQSTLNGNLVKAKDGVGLLTHAKTSIESFIDAVEKLVDPDLSDDAKCTEASKEDERGLAEAFRVVRDGVKLKVAQFTHQIEFINFSGAIYFLTVDGILAVNTNIDEAEVQGANAQKIGTARARIGAAITALFKGDLNKAVDQAQSAYDLISNQANTAPECLEERL